MGARVTFFPGLGDEVGRTLAHDLRDIERAVGLAGDSDGTEHSLSFQLKKKKKKKAPEVNRNGSLSKPPLPPPHTENTAEAKSLALHALGLNLIELFLAVSFTELPRASAPHLWRGDQERPARGLAQSKHCLNAAGFSLTYSLPVL